jgi:hypothetical protein
VLLVGAIALLSLLGFKGFSSAIRDKGGEQASCVASLEDECDGRDGPVTGAASDGDDGKDGSRAPRTDGRAVGRAWAVGIVKGALLEGVETLESLGTLAWASSTPGLVYYDLKGKPNPAMEAGVALGKLALSASGPGRLVAALGGPDPLNDAAVAGSQRFRAAWQRDKGETIGRLLFFAATIWVPVSGELKALHAAAKEARGTLAVAEEAIELERAVAVATRSGRRAAAEAAEGSLGGAIDESVPFARGPASDFRPPANPARLVSREARRQSLAFSRGKAIEGGTKLADGFADGGRSVTIGSDGTMIAPHREVVVVDRTRDAKLAKDLEYARSLRDMPHEERARKLAEYVDKRMSPPEGRRVARDALENWKPTYVGKEVLVGDVGDLGGGVCRHRAVMYKVLGDEAGLDVALQRGHVELIGADGLEFGPHQWNDVRLPDGRHVIVDVAKPQEGYALPVAGSDDGPWYYTVRESPMYGSRVPSRRPRQP